MSRKTFVLSVVAGVAAVGITVAVLHRRPTVNVAYAEVTQGSVVRQVLTTGTLEPKKAVDTGSQVSGTVQSIDADFNTRVRAGQVIARLDPSTYDAEVAKAEAAVAQADADALRLSVAEADASTKLDRAETLAHEELIPETELEDARVTAKQAVADLRAQRATATSARATLKQAQFNRDHTIIHSPIDGVVVNRNVEVGQTLASSFQSPVLFTIADVTRMNLLADIDQSEVGDIKAGTHVSFQVESLGPRTFDATVAEVRLEPNVAEAASPSGTATASTTGTSGAAAARGSSSGGSSGSSPTAVGTAGLATSNGPGVVSYTAVIDVANPDNVLAPGTTATIALPVGTRTNVVRIPNNALTFRPSVETFEALGQPVPKLETEKNGDKASASGRLGYVWKFENRRFIPIQVRTGLADEQWTEMVSGEVRVGEQLVTRAGM